MSLKAEFPEFDVQVSFSCFNIQGPALSDQALSHLKALVRQMQWSAGAEGRCLQQFRESYPLVNEWKKAASLCNRDAWAKLVRDMPEKQEL
eukprot:4049507-Lingulodinium_polyedra.AAC.1